MDDSCEITESSYELSPEEEAIYKKGDMSRFRDILVSKKVIDLEANDSDEYNIEIKNSISYLHEDFILKETAKITNIEALRDINISTVNQGSKLGINLEENEPTEENRGILQLEATQIKSLGGDLNINAGSILEKLSKQDTPFLLQDISSSKDTYYAYEGNLSVNTENKTTENQNIN